MTKLVAPLKRTDEYHKKVGGTPPEKVRDNLGKCLAELMSDEEIIKYLEDQRSDIIENFE